MKYIENEKVVGGAFVPKNVVAIDLLDINNLDYFDESGNACPMSPERGIAHETIHAYRYHNEFFKGYINKESNTIEKANEIMREINPKSIDRVGHKLKWRNP